MAEHPGPRKPRTARKPAVADAPADPPHDVVEVVGELAHPEQALSVPLEASGAAEPAPPATTTEPERPLAGFRGWVARMRMEGMPHEVDGFGMDPLFQQRSAPLLEFLYGNWWRISLLGVENIPAEGRAMLVANHSGGLPYDALMLQHGVRRTHPRGRIPRPLVEDAFFYLPFAGTFLSRLGGVRANPDNAERLLRDEQLLAVFPEGIKGLSKSWRDRYRLQRFGRGGFVKLARRTGTPILPVAILGAEEVHPVLRRLPLPFGDGGLPYLPVTPTFPWLGPLGVLPLPSRWVIRIGPPVDLSVKGERDPEDPTLVNELAERVRSEIQRMLDDGLAARRSVVFG